MNADRFTFASIIAVVQAIVGGNCVLFAVLLFLNLCDFFSAYMCIFVGKRTYQSRTFAIGVVRTVGNWLTIALGFIASAAIRAVGNTVGVDLGITQLVGWFVLASFIFNEFRSTLGNLNEAGVRIPAILINVLKLAEKTFDDVVDEAVPDGELVIDANPNSDFLSVRLTKELRDISSLKQVTFNVVHEDSSQK